MKPVVIGVVLILAATAAVFGYTQVLRPYLDGPNEAVEQALRGYCFGWAPGVLVVSDASVADEWEQRIGQTSPLRCAREIEVSASSEDGMERELAVAYKRANLGKKSGPLFTDDMSTDEIVAMAQRIQAGNQEALQGVTESDEAFLKRMNQLAGELIEAGHYNEMETTVTARFTQRDGKFGWRIDLGLDDKVAEARALEELRTLVHEGRFEEALDLAREHYDPSGEDYFEAGLFEPRAVFASAICKDIGINTMRYPASATWVLDADDPTPWFAMYEEDKGLYTISQEAVLTGQNTYGARVSYDARCRVEEDGGVYTGRVLWLEPELFLSGWVEYSTAEARSLF